MPQMGESIAEGTVSKWLKKVGDVVKRDEPIFEISTDKVDAEIPSPTAGRLAEILVGEGSTVAVQTIVARIETDVAASVAAPAPAPAVVASAPASVAASSASAPPVRPPVGNGNGASFEERVRTKSSPLVRKIAAEHGIELASVSGSGIAGRVTKRDIESLVANRGAAKPPVVGRPATPHVVAEGPLPEAWEGDVIEPMTKMRA